MKPTCIDLRPWAKSHRYRWRWEESRQIGEDDPFFVEILCRYGLIYPNGKDVLLAYASSGMKSKIRALGPDIKHHQSDGNNEVFRFPVERLDDVAGILKPKRLGGSAALTERQRENLQRYAFKGGENRSRINVLGR
jgi:hypothetical protein